MKKILSKILPILVLLLIVGVALVPEVSRAEPNILEGPVKSVVNTLIANIGYWILTVVSSVVIVSGTFLSVAINITTHIGDLFKSIPALSEIWVIIRNLSSIFIIFMLLYSSITTILGVEGPSMKKLIGNIIMAGLLINFSLFFVKIAIDASNLVSLQFYRAIAPNASENLRIGSIWNDGGLSDVFMSSLKIPQIYQNTQVLKSLDVTLSISIATVGGIVMMVTAALSFFAAAIMFTIRTALLLFIMALSPVFFAGMIFPAIKKDVSDKLFGVLKSQLIFMPAYLLLMYICLKLISSDGFSAIFNANNSGIIPAGESAFGPTFIGVIVQYTVALLFINAPLVFAIQLGGIGAKWVPGSKGVGDVAQWFGASTARNTLGYAANRIGESERFRSIIAKTPIGGLALSKAVAGVSGASFGGKKGGYDAQVKADAKAMEEFNKKIGKVNRVNYNTDKEYKDAKDRASDLQKTQLNSMMGRSLWGRMTTSRGSQQTYEKLTEDNDKKEAKKNKKANEEKLKEHNEIIKQNKEKIKNGYEGTGFATKPLSSAEKDRLNKEVEELEKKNKELINKIGLADKASEDDLIEKFRKAAEKEDKPPKEEKSDGGDKKKE